MTSYPTPANFNVRLSNSSQNKNTVHTIRIYTKDIGCVVALCGELYMGTDRQPFLNCVNQTQFADLDEAIVFLNEELDDALQVSMLDAPRNIDELRSYCALDGKAFGGIFNNINLQSDYDRMISQLGESW